MVVDFITEEGEETRNVNVLCVGREFVKFEVSSP